MKTTAPQTLRRSLYGVFGACLIGGSAAAVIAVPSATAAPNPCAASAIARTIGSVSTSTGNYLDTHPDTNSALTYAAQQPPTQALASLKTYFDANPQAGKDLQTIQQPLTGLTGQCKLPITVPQALQFLQAAAQNGLGTSPASAGLPGGALPGGPPASPAGGLSVSPGAPAQPAQVPPATTTTLPTVQSVPTTAYTAR